jgi:NTP pyrophosphatase (non-canonical NTP hydrolase)
MREEERIVRDGIDASIALCHSESLKAGWWENGRNSGEMIALIHSEISEALEGLRKDRFDDHLPHRKMLEVELADALIRIFDMAGGLSLDLSAAMMEKIAYNRDRLDHKREARAAPGGKAF